MKLKRKGLPCSAVFIGLFLSSVAWASGGSQGGRASIVIPPGNTEPTLQDLFEAAINPVLATGGEKIDPATDYRTVPAIRDVVIPGFRAAEEKVPGVSQAILSGLFSQTFYLVDNVADSGDDACDLVRLEKIPAAKTIDNEVVISRDLLQNYSPIIQGATITHELGIHASKKAPSDCSKPIRKAMVGLLDAKNHSAEELRNLLDKMNIALYTRAEADQIIKRLTPTLERGCSEKAITDKGIKTAIYIPKSDLDWIKERGGTFKSRLPAVPLEFALELGTYDPYNRNAPFAPGWVPEEDTRRGDGERAEISLPKNVKSGDFHKQNLKGEQVLYVPYIYSTKDLCERALNRTRTVLGIPGNDSEKLLRKVSTMVETSQARSAETVEKILPGDTVTPSSSETNTKEIGIKSDQAK